MRLVAILCSLLPVKYCKAAPKLSFLTTLKSQSNPALNLTDDLVPPFAQTLIIPFIWTK